jgi:hypothetical protein
VKQVTQQDGSPFFLILCKTQQEAGGYWPARSTMGPLFNNEHLAIPNLESVFLKVPRIPEVPSRSCTFFLQVEMLTH